MNEQTKTKIIIIIIIMFVYFELSDATQHQ